MVPILKFIYKFFQWNMFLSEKNGFSRRKKFLWQKEIAAKEKHLWQRKKAFVTEAR